MDYKYKMRKMENKLTELMGKEDYGKWSREVAVEAFRRDVEKWPDGEFKQFCLDNFEIITGDDEQYVEWLRSMSDEQGPH